MADNHIVTTPPHSVEKLVLLQKNVVFVSFSVLLDI